MTFSVIIPVHNRAGAVLKAVHSVLDQTYEDFELIAVDDGSTDGTAQVLKSIKDDRFRCVHQENKERSAARNRGVSIASGRYVTFLDSDDEALPCWLSTFSDLCESKNAAVACTGYIKTEQKIGRSIEKEIFPHNLGPLFHNKKCMFWPAGTFAVRRDLFDSVGGYVESLTYGENTELGLRLIDACIRRNEKIVASNNALIRYHPDPNEIRINPHAILNSMQYVFDRHSDALSRDPRVHGYYLSMAGVNASRTGKHAAARKFFRKAIRIHPRGKKHYFRYGLSMIPSLAARFWAVR